MDGQVDRMTLGVSCNMSHVHGVERADNYPASQSQTSYKQLSQSTLMSFFACSRLGSSWQAGKAKSC